MHLCPLYKPDTDIFTELGTNIKHDLTTVNVINLPQIGNKSAAYATFYDDSLGH